METNLKPQTRMSNLRNLIPDATISDELIWYYNAADAAVGIRSNYMAMITPSTTATVEDPYIGYLPNITRRRTIEKALNQLPRRYQLVLQAMYGHHRLPPTLTNLLGSLAGVALCTDVDMSAADFISLCHRIQIGTATEAEQVQLAQIRRLATDLQINVIRAYRIARSKNL